MTSKELMNLDAQCVMQTYGRFPVAIDPQSPSLAFVT